MGRRIDLFTAIVSVLMAAAANPGHARADGFSLEGGLVLGPSLPTGTEMDEEFGEFGVTGQAGYEARDWSFGVRGMNTISNKTSLQILADSLNLSGTLSRRLIQIEIFGRLFFHDSITGQKRWYLELGFLGLEIDFIHSDAIYVYPKSVDYTRLFLRGNGFTLGAGFRPRNGPWFYQVNYELRRYQAVLVEGEVNHLHQTVEEASLNNNYFIHSFVLMVGLDVFGR